MGDIIEKDSNELNLIQIGIVGSIGLGSLSVVSQTADAPLERVKLLLQNQGEMLKQDTISRPYNGIIDCAMQIYRNESLIDFWRGNLTGCIRFFSNGVLNISLKDKIETMFKQNENDSYMIDFAKNLASGGVAGALSLCFVYPFDYARTRLANDVINTKKGGNEYKYNGLVDVYRKTLSTDGIAGVYRGFLFSCVYMTVYRGCYFGTYDTLQPIVLGPDPAFILSFLLSYGITVTSSLIPYPFDSISRRMMMTSCQPIKYKGAMDYMLQIIRNEGTIALFKGFSVDIIRSIPIAILVPGVRKIDQLYANITFDTIDSD